MLVLSGALTPLSAPVAQRFGARTPIVAGLALMAAGALALSAVPASAPTETVTPRGSWLRMKAVISAARGAERA